MKLRVRLRVAGVDEAGRGPLAGPVVAAAVILNPARPIRGLADSKVLEPEERERLAVLDPRTGVVLRRGLGGRRGDRQHQHPAGDHARDAPRVVRPGGCRRSRCSSTAIAARAPTVSDSTACFEAVIKGDATRAVDQRGVDSRQDHARCADARSRSPLSRVFAVGSQGISDALARRRAQFAGPEPAASTQFRARCASARFSTTRIAESCRCRRDSGSARAPSRKATAGIRWQHGAYAGRCGEVSGARFPFHPVESFWQGFLLARSCVNSRAMKSAPVTFVHLRLHTEFSLQDSVVRIPELVERVASLGMPAVAVTDQNNLFAMVKFYREGLKRGVKPIIGVDVLLRARRTPAAEPPHAALQGSGRLSERHQSRDARLARRPGPRRAAASTAAGSTRRRPRG